jgi:hypothetical protein
LGGFKQIHLVALFKESCVLHMLVSWVFCSRVFCFELFSSAVRNLLYTKNYHLITWRGSISRPIALISSVAGGDVTAMYVDHATIARSMFVSAFKRDVWIRYLHT